jgi:hypothetical protein
MILSIQKNSLFLFCTGIWTTDYIEFFLEWSEELFARKSYIALQQELSTITQQTAALY